MMRRPMGTVAITRDVSRSIARCELTHVARVAIDYANACRQHAEYAATLARLGCSVLRVGADSDLPDSVFIEDAAVVFAELAIVTRPGAVSRRLETAAVAGALERFRPLAWIQPPGTIDGGDVLVIGRTIFVGVSGRTNQEGVDQFRRILSPVGYEVRAVAVRHCLHLKSAVTSVNDETLLVNRAWAPADAFTAFDLVDVDPAEPWGANIVRVNDRLLYSAGFPRTRERLEQRGFEVTTVDMSELAKAEGAVSCCSLIFEAPLKSGFTAP
jgi:dimethylargininase